MTINEVCLKLLNKFIEVCDAHNLKIFLNNFHKNYLLFSKSMI